MATTQKELAQERDAAFGARIDLLSAVMAEGDTDPPMGSIEEAEQSLATVRASHDAARVSYEQASAEISRVRKELGKPLMPSQLESLAKDLRAAIIAQRDANGSLLDAEESLSAASAELSARVTSLGRAKEGRTNAKSEIAAATAREKTFAEWHVTLTASDARAEAGTALGEDPYVAAKARVDGDIPTGLRDIARKRGDYQAERVKGAAATRDHARALVDAGTVSAVAHARASLADAEAGFEALLRLSERAGHAVARMAAITRAPPLTAAERARIHEGGIPSQGAPAAALEAAIYDVISPRDALIGQLQRLDLDVEAAGGTPTPAQETEKTDLEANVAAAEADLAAAEAAFTTTEKNRLERWEAAVPEHVWRLLIEFDKAEADLIAVRDAPTAAAAMASIAAAEQDLVSKLETEDEEHAIRKLLIDAHARLAGTHALLEGIAARRHLSAVRGDN